MPASKAACTQERCAAREVEALLAVLVIGMFVLGGLSGVVWYVSQRMYREGLRPGAARIRPVVAARVVEVTAGEVVLEPTSKRSLRVSGLWGLCWDDGYARVSNAVPESGGRVRYSAELMQGELSEGLRCELDVAAFPPDAPEAAGMSEVVYPTPFGDYTGWFAAGVGTTWLILVHGKDSSHREMLRMVEAARGHQLPTLSVIYRNDEGAPATDDGMFHFGRDEWRDLEAAVEYAMANGATDVVIAAESIGAPVALWFLHQSALGERVRGMLLDSSALDMGSAALWVGKNTSPLPRPLVRLGMVAAALRFGFNWADYDTRPVFGELGIPVTLVHGERDGQMPIAVSEQVAAMHPELVTLVRVPGAGHCQTWNADPARYEAMVDSLISRALGRPEAAAAGVDSTS